VSVLAHFFESFGLSTVLVGFVKEHIQAIKPPRALWLDFPMGRPLGKPNDIEFQKKIIRTAFKMFNEKSGPVLREFPDVIPVKNGRMGYALPVELVIDKNNIGNIDLLVQEVKTEIESLNKDYTRAVTFRKRTTLGASEMKISDYVNYISLFIKGDIPNSPRKGIGPVPLLKLVVEDLQAYYTETITFRDKIDDFEKIGTWFWEKTKAGKLILCLEAVSLKSENRVLKQIVDMSLITPRFWSEGPLPGTSGSGW